jgi:hypothetical protein
MTRMNADGFSQMPQIFADNLSLATTHRGLSTDSLLTLSHRCHRFAHIIFLGTPVAERSRSHNKKQGRFLTESTDKRRRFHTESTEEMHTENHRGLRLGGEVSRR